MKMKLILFLAIPFGIYAKNFSLEEAPDCQKNSNYRLFLSSVNILQNSTRGFFRGGIGTLLLKIEDMKRNEEENASEKNKLVDDWVRVSKDYPKSFPAIQGFCFEGKDLYIIFLNFTHSFTDWIDDSKKKMSRLFSNGSEETDSLVYQYKSTFKFRLEKILFPYSCLLEDDIFPQNTEWEREKLNNNLALFKDEIKLLDPDLIQIKPKFKNTGKPEVSKETENSMREQKLKYTKYILNILFDIFNYKIGKDESPESLGNLVHSQINKVKEEVGHKRFDTKAFEKAVNDFLNEYFKDLLEQRKQGMIGNRENQSG